MKLKEVLPEGFTAHAATRRLLGSYLDSATVIGYLHGTFVSVIVFRGVQSWMAVLHHRIHKVLPCFGGYNTYRLPLAQAIPLVEAHGTILRKAAWQDMVARAVAKAV